MRRRLVVAAALIACPLANAASVQAIFSAENALYGAGYDIGQADGWIDDRLRSAIQQYQTDRPGLSATGELDSQTLAELGISGNESDLVGGNVASSRKAAREELGLVLISAAPSTSPASPEPEPEPAQPVATPEPAAEPEPQPEPEPEVIAEQVEEPVEEQVAVEAEEKEKSEEEVAAVNEPEPTQEPVEKSEPEPEPTSQPVVIASVSRNIDKVNEPDDSAGEASQTSVQATAVPEPTAATAGEDAVSSGSDSTSPQAESSGNVLTRMFDFLFGWMV